MHKDRMLSVLSFLKLRIYAKWKREKYNLLTLYFVSGNLAWNVERNVLFRRNKLSLKLRALRTV